MNTFRKIAWSIIIAVFAFSLAPLTTSAATVDVVNAYGQKVTLPLHPQHIICSGPGSLRLVTYLKAQDRIIAVDDMETKRTTFRARPYFLANLHFEDYPVFGEFRGKDNPEIIVTLNPAPELIIKTFPEMGYNPQELQNKTGIPVLALNYGDLSENREVFYSTLRTIAEVLGTEERAEELISFFDSSLEDLRIRTADIPEMDKPSCYVGGIAFKGPHGIQSTEPGYPPFMYTGAANVAAPKDGEPKLEHTSISREKLITWNPEFIFIDLATIKAPKEANAILELRDNSIYRNLRAVKKKRVYGVLPYNWYSINYGSILGDAYFVGKILFPDRFTDIEPDDKADQIYEFLLGKKVMDKMSSSFEDLPFRNIANLYLDKK